jgi:two-component sensor histidine kinase
VTTALTLALVHPEDRPLMRTAWETAHRDGTFAAEFRGLRRRPDGMTDERWFLSRGRVVHGRRGRVMIGVNLDITDRRHAEERILLLAREVDHRAKNALAVVQAALRLTPRSDAESYAGAVEGRVAALARAQTLLAADRWSGAELRGLIEGELAAFLGAGQRVELEGPSVTLPAGATQAFAMAIHELATNALKHGALSASGGRVGVTWSLRHDVLRLRWEEAGGPPLNGPPARRGFGSRVLEETIRGQLGGSVSLDWATGGLACELSLPLRAAPLAAVAMQ